MLYPYPPRCSALYQKLRNQPDTVKGAITDRSNTQWQCDLSINRTDVQPVGFSRDTGIGKMFSAMQYDRLIERTLRDAQGVLRANLPPAKNLSDNQAVQSLRAIVRAPQVREVLERGQDTALCFVLRAVNRILADDGQPDRMTINRLWDVLDEPEFNRMLGRLQNMKKPPAQP
jgi:hypothetical protein